MTEDEFFLVITYPLKSFIILTV